MFFNWEVTCLFKRKRNFRSAFVIIFFLIVFGSLYLLDITLRTTFYSIAEVRAVQLATDVIQRAIQHEAVDENLQYQDFIKVDKDSQGHIVLMQANTAKLNLVATNTTLTVQKTLENLRWQVFSIPLGQVLGIPMLANYGPRVAYHIMPVGTVRVSIVDKFESAGINQTKHIIYLNFDTSVRIVIPTKSGETVVATQMPLAESIIVGNVPSTFVNVSGGIFGSGLIK